MVFYKLDLAGTEVTYCFPTKKGGSDNPNCDSKGNILDRINETKQQEAKIEQVNQEVITLDMKQQRGQITAEEEKQLEKLRYELSIRQGIYNLKPFFISEDGEIHQKALKLVNGEPMESFKARAKQVKSEDYRFCEIDECYKKEYEEIQSGFMLSPEWYKTLKEKNLAIKWNFNYGMGWNEVRTYAYPSRVDNVLIMVKVNNPEQIYERMNEELETFKNVAEMKELLKQIKLQADEINRGKVAGSLDD